MTACKRRQNLWAAALLLCLLLPLDAAARWYQVEVIAFRHVGAAATASEKWPELSALPDFGKTMTLIRELPGMDDEPDFVAAEDEAPALPIAFEALDEDELRLAGVLKRLRRSGEYEPLLVAGWRQPSFGVRRPKRIYLSDRQPVPDLPVEQPAVETIAPAPVVSDIEGIVAIKVSRLLHVELDFLYYHEGAPIRLTDRRKVKLREIHYFDHPLFGVIVQVSPFVLPRVPATSDVDGEEPEDPGEPNAAPAPQPAAIEN